MSCKEYILRDHMSLLFFIGGRLLPQSMSYIALPRYYVYNHQTNVVCVSRPVLFFCFIPTKHFIFFAQPTHTNMTKKNNSAFQSPSIAFCIYFCLQFSYRAVKIYTHFILRYWMAQTKAFGLKFVPWLPYYFDSRVV